MKRQAPGEFYHIYNRGIQKQPIFISDADRLRFLFLILMSQGSNTIGNAGRVLKSNVQHLMLNIKENLVNESLKKRKVELVAFCMMPNHFHLIVHELEEGGISKYMQRVQNAYAKYFNTKYEKTGHLFQGVYKSKHISDDIYLMHLSAYIHKNPNELMNSRWIEENEERYYWSSYRDFIFINRFPRLLMPGIINDRFTDGKSGMTYKKFVKTSPAKEMQNKLGDLK